MAKKNLVKSAKKRLSDMHYKERVTCIMKLQSIKNVID
jgi:hypothetical protein